MPSNGRPLEKEEDIFAMVTETKGMQQKVRPINKLKY
jgi:hypothetical protein